MSVAELRHRLIAAVPVPFDASATVDPEAQARFASHLAGLPIGGVAVWAHTGRGLRLTADQRAAVLIDWKAGLAGRGLLIASAGAPPGEEDAASAFRDARAMAE